MSPRRGGGEHGTAMVEFLGAALLLVAAVLGLAQLAVWVWARGIVVNAAHDGARVAAEAGSSDAAGADRTRTLLRDGLGSGTASRFDVRVAHQGAVVAARVRGTAPVLVPFLPAFPLDARARVLAEDEVGP